jgi:biopolymer transport protein ExbB
MEMLNTLVKFFQEGGFFMYPIALVMALGIAIGIERYIYLHAALLTNRSAVNRLLPLMQQRDFPNAIAFVNSSKTAICRIVAYGLARMPHTQRREDIEHAMDEGLMEAIPRLERRTQYLATYANIATLLGLLGTIIGLIEAFTAVGTADASQKAALLSQSISVAMNTTAFGLIVAIPLLLVHTMLTTKTNEIVDSLEMASVKIINLLSEKR